MNVFLYKAPDVVIKRSMEELEVDFIEYKIIEKRLFDYLIAAKDTPIDMVDKQADIIWHNYILNTRSYRDFCSTYFGKFIDHEPYLNDSVLNEGDIVYIAETIVQAVKQYRSANDLLPMDEGHYRYDEHLFNKIRKLIKGNI